MVFVWFTLFRLNFIFMKLTHDGFEYSNVFVQLKLNYGIFKGLEKIHYH